MARPRARARRLLGEAVPGRSVAEHVVLGHAGNDTTPGPGPRNSTWIRGWDYRVGRERACVSLARALGRRPLVIAFALSSRCERWSAASRGTAETGLGQRELARRTGIPQPTLSRIERGLASPRFDTLDAAAGVRARAHPDAAPAAETVDRHAESESVWRSTPGERARLAVREWEGTRVFADQERAR